MKVRKSIVFDGKMGMRKFWSVALPFGKVACVVKVRKYYIKYIKRTKYIKCANVTNMALS